MRIIHWLMAVIIIGLLAVGLYMTSLEGTNPLKRDIYNLHKSIGVIALFLIFIRIIIRVTLNSKIPPLAKSFAKWEKISAKAGHFALYVFMCAMAISGYIMSAAGGYGVKFFGIEIPNIVGEDKELAGIAHEIHNLLPILFIIIILTHIGAVIKHRYIDKEEDKDVLGKMI